MSTRRTISGAVVALLSGAAIAALPALGHAQSTSDVHPMEACNGTYTHCETNQCASGDFYRNYDPSADHFFDAYGTPLAQGEQGDIRNEPYRRTGPRGVRAMHAGVWGFYSTSCFPG